MRLEMREVEDLGHLSRHLLDLIRGWSDGACLVALSGELGAGKTTLVSRIARDLGVKEQVISPTFIIERTYPLQSLSPFARLVHIDAYRLQGAEQLAPLRFAEKLQDPQNLIFLEWPENVSGALPDRYISVTLRHAGGGRTADYAIISKTNEE